MKKQWFQYSSNNSGGRWWLKDKDWVALEKNGWEVKWIKNQKPMKIGGKTFTLGMADKDGRWLGALSKSAKKKFSSLKECIAEFEKITGQDVTNEGCNCCGSPHTFYWGRAVDGQEKTEKEYGYASGESLLQYMTDKEIPKSLRESLGV